MSTGQGFAGILMNLTRYITLAAFSSDEFSSSEEKKINKFRESLVFFSFSGLICFLCILCTLYLYRNEYFIRKTSNASISSKYSKEERDIKDVENIKINSQLLEKIEVKNNKYNISNIF